MTSLVAEMVKHLPTMWETQVQSLGWEDLLGKEMATHSSILAWKIPWTEPARLQSVGSQRVRHDYATSLLYSTYISAYHIYTFMQYREHRLLVYNHKMIGEGLNYDIYVN